MVCFLVHVLPCKLIPSAPCIIIGRLGLYYFKVVCYLLLFKKIDCTKFLFKIFWTTWIAWLDGPNHEQKRDRQYYVQLILRVGSRVPKNSPLGTWELIFMLSNYPLPHSIVVDNFFKEKMWSTPQPIILPEYYPSETEMQKGPILVSINKVSWEYWKFCRDTDKQPHCHIPKPLLKSTKI
jgi:hypothetical protein